MREKIWHSVPNGNKVEYIIEYLSVTLCGREINEEQKGEREREREREREVTVQHL